MISHWDDVPWTVHEHGELRCQRQRLSRPRGGVGATLSRYRIPAAARSMPQHVHGDEEELFVVLEGDGTLLLGDERHAVRPGSIVARPPATGVAHCFEAGQEGLVLLAYGTRVAADTCWCPDSSKISFRGLGVIGRLEPLDSWDGEE